MDISFIKWKADVGLPPENNKKLIVFPVCWQTQVLLKFHNLEDIFCFCDNSQDWKEQKWYDLRVASPKDLSDIEGDLRILITEPESVYYLEKQLKKYNILDRCELIVCNWSLMSPQKFFDPFTFEDRRKNYNKALIVLAGYKPQLWDIVFKRIERFLPGDIDMCVMTSGKYVPELSQLCAKNDWSYLSTTINHVSLIQNIALQLHQKAEYIYKLDEDIFICEGFFEGLMQTYIKVETNSHYHVGMVTPIIPINPHGNVRFMEKTGCLEEYEAKFGKAYYDFFTHFDESTGETLFLWEKTLPLDDTAKKLRDMPFSYFICPHRFSIGAILFKRAIWEEMGGFEVYGTGGVGADEYEFARYLLAEINFYTYVMAENVLAGHYSFGKIDQPELLDNFYQENKKKFDLSKNYQGKVSMVVPCYNKELYIGEMLDSVIAQLWDNIELILVNDGSTDGTREIIAQYEPKLRARGYEVVIVDQENGGCCAAVHAGLIRMTGDYFCLVDCDDSIDPEYVSRMAEWLDKHEDYQWAACSYKEFFYENDTLKIGDAPAYKYQQDTPYLLEKWIMRDALTTVWIYMARTSYVKQCGMIENWCTQRKKTYEPLIGIPLMAGRGKIKYFHEGLYQYHLFARDLYQFERFEQATAYYDDYLYLYEWAINRLNVSDEEKQRILSLSRLSYQREMFIQAFNLKESKECMSKIAASTSALLDELFVPSPNIPAQQVLDAGYRHLFDALGECVFPDGLFYRPTGRIIGYGAMGRAAEKLLPQLENTAWKPTELWDKGGDGTIVKKPDFASLSQDDTVMVFPTLPEAVTAIEKELKNTGAKIIYNHDIKARLQFKLNGFNQLERARLRQ